MRYGEDDYGNNGGDPFFGDFAVYGANPEASAYRMPTPAPYMPPAMAQPMSAAAQPGVPEMTPEFIQQLQQGAALMGNSPLFNDAGGLSTLQPGTLNPLDPLYDYAKTAPILSLKGNEEYENLNFQALPDTNYRLTVGGNVVGSASTPEEVARLVQQANAISEQGGKTVDVRLQKEVQAASPTGEPYTAFNDVYANQPNNNGFLDTALPAALAVMGGAALGPLLGGIGTAGKAGVLGASKLAGAAGAGLGSAAGSFAGSVATGADIEEALKKAAISGVTAGALKGAMPGGSSGGIGPMPDIDYAGLNSAVFGGGAALPSAALEPMLTATAGKLAGAALPSVFGGAASGLASSAPGSSTPDEGMLEALGTRAPPAAPSIPGGIANIVGAAEPLGRMPETIEEEATVTGKRYDDPSLGASLSVPANVAPPLLETTLSDIMQQYEAPPTEEAMQTVEQARPEQPTPPPLFAPPSAPLLETTLSDIMQQYEAPPTEEAMETVEQARPEQPTAPPLFVPPFEALPPFDVANIVGAGEALGRMPETIEEEATVTGKRYDDPSLGASLVVPPVSPPVVDADYSVFPGDEPMLESSPDRLQREDFSSPLVVPPVSPLPTFEAPFTGVDTPVDAPAEEEQVVSARRPDVVPPLSAGIAVPPLIIPPFAAPPTVPAGGGAGSTVKKVLGGLTLLDLLSGALGGGSGNAATGGAGKLNPIFSAKLPGASPAFSQQSLAPRPGGVSGPAMDDIDWYRYGYNPERSFFNYVPATQTEREAMMVKPPSQLEQKARGGALAVKKGGAPAKESFAVKGPGTGRSDEIPALLSDGEYVIDAETVALLGDGSSEAGAKRLDDFRVSIRKHKGSNLARGKFSANAKRPEKYLSGGRT